MIGVLRLLLKDLEPPIDGLWINELMDHRDDLMKDSIMASHITSVQKIILEELELENRFSADDVLHAFGVLRINSFGIETAAGGEGRGLFPLLALMSHSCQSNLQHEQSKSSSEMVLTAQRTIEAGEELTIRYIDTIQGTLETFMYKVRWRLLCTSALCINLL